MSVPGRARKADPHRRACLGGGPAEDRERRVQGIVEQKEEAT